MKNYLMGFEATRIQGGMQAFEKTGIYPDYLHFKSAYYQHTWKEQCTSETQEGSLSIHGKVVYLYKLSENACLIKPFHEEAPVSEWVPVPFGHMMMD